MNALKTIRTPLALAALLAGLALLSVGVVDASAAPVWRLDSLANSTVAPGGTLEYSVQATNLGTATNGSEVVLTAVLPPGFTAINAVLDSRIPNGPTGPGQTQSYPCTAGDGVSPVAGATQVRCGDSATVPAAGEANFQVLRLTVAVDPVVEGTPTASFSITGGGAAAGASTVDPTVVTPEAPAFGVDAFEMGVLGATGQPFTQAGGHPADVRFDLDFNRTTDPAGVAGPVWPVEAVRDVFTDLPPGFIGNPTAASECTLADLTNNKGGLQPLPLCRPSSQVGTITLRHNGHGTYVINERNIIGPYPLYRLVTPPGVTARFGFNIFSTPVVIDASVRNGGDYNVVVASRDILEAIPLVGVQIDFWGQPGAKSHDPERACPGQEAPAWGGPTCEGAGNQPFFRNPTSCAGEGLQFAVHMDSWVHPGTLGALGVPDLTDPNWKSSTTTLHEAPGYPYPPDGWGGEVGMTGCERVPVKGTLAAEPTALETESPSGLVVHVEVPNQGLENPEGIASSDIKAVRVALPVGMTINPSQAEGLNVCTPAQYASSELSFHPDGTKGCPSDSKIGSIVLHTPLLEEAIEGNVYIAKPFDNPFGSLLALYLVLENPERGILIKQAGKVETDPVTGQVVTTFDNIPQLPFSNFDFKFREGTRAPLVTPSACGTYTTKTWFTPWSAPSTQLESDSQFEVVKGIGGGSCPSGGVPPFAPQMVSGTLNNAAGANSPFFLHITRQDGEQEITRFSTVLAPGLTGNLTGIPFCPDSAIEAARQKTGAQELASPSCPAASEIGHTIVGAGVGSVLAHTPGKVYLAGPYKGSGLSIVSITSATVGPFDLGTVVIRFGLHINPITAQVEVDAAGSDPIPHIIDGIVVHVRDIRVYIDRPNFIRNPTNCGPLGITNTITGAGADYTNPADQHAVSVSAHFQASDCSLLGFKPSFKVSTSVKTSRVNGASLHVLLTYPNAPDGSQANIRSVKVALPKQLPSRLTTLQKACRDTVFSVNPAACPPESRVGMAKAITPILPVPLEGPAYFVSHGGAKFPELIIVLQGYGFTIDLHGETFINEKTNITSSTFRTVPDQPVKSFELTLPAGRYSALAAPTGLCGKALKMPTAFTAQNGAVIHQSTPIAVAGCKPSLTVRSRKVTGARATVALSVPMAGALSASGQGIASVHRRVAAPGEVSLSVALTVAERRFLAAHPGRRARVQVRLALAGAHGAKLHSSLTLLLG
jgi:uncharacterized repeat protein (TIGR01451 family)